MTKRRFGGGSTIPASLVCLVGLLSAFVRADDPEQFSDWTTPINLGLPVNHVTGDFSSFVSRDGLSLYFTITTCPSTGACFTDPDASGGTDIYVSQWDSVNHQWSQPKNLGPTINTSANDMAPSLSPDGHVMYFASDRPGGFGRNDLYASRRKDKRDDFGWQAPVNLGSTVNTAPDVQPDGTVVGGNESSPEVFEDDATGVVTLYFDSNRIGGLGPFTGDHPPAHNGNDIYASIQQPDGTFGPPVLVPNVNSTSFDRGPAIRRDGLEMFFASNRSGSLGGTLDLWVSTRPSTSAPWSTPVTLGTVVNSDRVTVGSITYSGSDAGPALSFDGTTLFFQSLRPGTFGAFDLYTNTREKLRD
jgi:WD40 repeat protein